MNDKLTHRVPHSGYDVVHRFYADSNSFKTEFNLLQQSYQADYEALEKKYAAELEALAMKYKPQMEELNDRISARQKEATKAFCAACGVEYRENSSYVIDTSYEKDFDLVVLNEYPDVVKSAALPDFSEERPDRSRLN